MSRGRVERAVEAPRPAEPLLEWEAAPEPAAELVEPVSTILEGLGLDWLGSLVPPELSLLDVLGDWLADVADLVTGAPGELPPGQEGAVSAPPGPALEPGPTPLSARAADPAEDGVPAARAYDAEPVAAGEAPTPVGPETGPVGPAGTPEAGTGRGMGPVQPPFTEWEVRAETDAAIEQLPDPQGPDAAQAAERIGSVAKRIAERSDQEVAAQRRLPASIVGRRPGVRIAPRPDPGPIPELLEALRKAGEQKLTRAVLPPVTLSPRGTLPDVSRKPLTDLEIRAIGQGDAAIVAMTGAGDPESMDEEKKLAEIRAGLGGATALAQPPPVKLGPPAFTPPASAPIVDEPVVVAGLTTEQQGMFALVVADLRSDPAEQGAKLMSSVRQAHSRFPGGELNLVFKDSPLTGGLLPTATSEMATETTALADALALTPEQLDRAVVARKQQVQERLERAAGMCLATKEDASQVAVQADARRRDGARQTVAGVASSAAADRKVPRPPSRTQRRLEKAMSDVNTTTATAFAQLDEQLRQRERAIADAVRVQVAAIRLAQTADELALQPREGTTRSTQKDLETAAALRRWAESSVTALTEGEASEQAKLVAAARTETEDFRVGVRTAASEAIAALRLWGAEHTKAKDAWWADLDAELGRWYGAALSSGSFWENQQGQASRIALAQDLESIKRISAIQEAGAKDEAKGYINRLDGEARAVVTALAAPASVPLRSAGSASEGGPGPDLVAALSAGLRERVRAKHQAEWESAIERELDALEVKDHVKDFEALVRVVQPGWDVERVVDKIHSAVTRLRGHDEESIFEALSGLTPIAAKMLKYRYEAKIGQSLEDALLGEGHVGHLTADEMDTAHQLMRGDRIDGAVGSIHSALMGAGSEMGAVKQILRGLKPDERTEALKRYHLRYGVSLEGELKEQWSVSKSELDESMALARSDLTGASATALKRTVYTIQSGGPRGYGIYGGEQRQAVIDRDAAAEVYAQIRKDVEAEAATRTPPWTSFQVEAEITMRSHELGIRFDEMAANEWWVKNQPAGTTATQAAFALASPAGQEFLKALAANDLVRLDVAKIRLEDAGLWASDAAILAVMRDQESRSVVAVQRDMGPYLQARTEAAMRREEPFENAEKRVDRRMELERENAAKVGELASQQTQSRFLELGALYQHESGRSLTAMVEDNMSFTSKREALARVRQLGVLTKYQKLKYAIEGLGTDMPMLRSTLVSMTKDEVAKADAEWRQEHDGESLVDAVRGDTSGRDQGDLADMAEYGGTPRSAAETVAAAERKLKRDQDAATALGGLATRKESDYAAKKVALLRTRLEEMRTTGTDSAAQWGAEMSFDTAVDAANTAIELQREALDSITDTLANAAAIVVAIVVGAVLAPFTAGGSAVVAAAIISSLVATAVSMAVKQAMKGSYYGRGEIATDLVIGGVDAVVSALTAGLAHGLLGRAVGNASQQTIRSLKFAERLSRLGAVGRAAAQGRGALARGASRFAFLQGMDESKNFAIRMIGRGTAQLLEQGVQAVPTSFAGALLDERLVYDPRGPALVLENTVYGTVHSTAMGLGLAAAHHVGAKALHPVIQGMKSVTEAVRVMAPAEVRMPTGDVLAHQGTPTERLNEFRSWKELNPAGTAKEFIAERRAQVIESWQLGELERGRVRDARAELVSGLLPTERGRYADLPMRSVGDAEFARMTGGSPADAKLVVREGQAVLVVRDGAAPGAVAAVLPEVQRRVFPGTFGLTVEAALPKSLRDTPIRIDPYLPHDEIRVQPIPPTGPITGVEVIVGPGVHPIDVGLHAGEIARVRRWTGRLGEARLAAASLMRKVGLHPVTPEDRVRFEAAGEVAKLEPLIEERIRRMGATGDPTTATAQRIRVLRLMAQHERYRRILTGEIEGAAKGYVAQEGEPSAAEVPTPKQPTITEAAVALTRLGQQGPLIEERVARSEEQFELVARDLDPFGKPLERAHTRLANEFPELELPDVPPVDEYRFAHERTELRKALRKIIDMPGSTPADRLRRGLATATRGALDAFEAKYRELEPRLGRQQLERFAAEGALQRHGEEVSQWVQVITGSPKLAKELTTKGRLMGVPLSRLLPPANAPDGYVPKVLKGSDADTMAHILGLHAEAHMANRIAEDMPEPHVVVDFGDPVGSTGYDAFSVDPHGMPHLWDSKFRSSGEKHVESPTFTEPSRIKKAVKMAIDALKEKPGRLTPEQARIALEHLGKGEFVAYTVTTKDATNFHSAVEAHYEQWGKVAPSVEVDVPWNH